MINSVYSYSKAENIFVNFFFGGINRINKIIKLFVKLKENNVDIYISSRGKLFYIIKCLEILDFKKYITCINSSDGVVSVNNRKINDKHSITKVKFINKFKILLLGFRNY